ncbi:hypothetical protein FQA47_016085 [Oryzias melastigma]|uniref:Uncharacterized protein n=1 Tax=Oryzias melastigma TaxID=30732 RepID=A0A834L0N7_ORYME|nr:hypothetical protein FQA47_016085 [Oryzias melastigma]
MSSSRRKRTSQFPESRSSAPKKARPEPSKKTDFSEEQEPSRCSVCRDILKVPVRSGCEQGLCTRCNRAPPSGPSSGPQSEQRSRTEAGPQTG